MVLTKSPILISSLEDDISHSSSEGTIMITPFVSLLQYAFSLYFIPLAVQAPLTALLFLTPL